MNEPEEKKIWGKKYTLSEVLERLLLTDEELLLCQQHREYVKKLDDVLPEIDSIGNLRNIGEPPE
jgi:hypothetical protein